MHCLLCHKLHPASIKVKLWPQAAQAVEPAALIPLQMLKPSGSVVLVGDPKQLPATVMSRAADIAGLSRSLFERLQQVRCPARCLRLPCTCNPHMFGDNSMTVQSFV